MAISSEIFNVTRENRLFMQGRIVGKGKQFDDYKYTYNVQIIAGNISVSNTISEYLTNIPVMGLNPGIDPGLEEGDFVFVGFVDKDMSFPIILNTNCSITNKNSNGDYGNDNNSGGDQIAIDTFEVCKGAEDLNSVAFYWPTQTVTTISSLFGLRWGRYHDGIDIAANSGTYVYAAHSGTVVSVNRNLNSSGYGRYVDLRSANGVRTRYAHGKEILVSKGDKVDAGTAIMVSGASGSSETSYEPHLHFEIGIEVDGKFLLVNPRQCSYIINGVEKKGSNTETFPCTGHEVEEIWVNNLSDTYSSWNPS